MLSIITPCYNHEHFLKKSVGSALRQQCEKEIIVVDDGSKEPVKNIWGDPVQVIRHPENRGLSAALNTGIELAKYDHFVICSADDALDPEYYRLLEYRDKADIISCDMMVGGRHIYMKPGSLEALKQGNCHSYAALIKKTIWRKLGGYKTTMNPSWEDWEFFLNAAKHKATWFHVPKPLHIYNRNPAGRDADSQDKERLLKGKLHGYHQDLYGKGQGVVAFIIPCYNQEKWLKEAIDSCFNQVYPHVQVVVVDDKSPGNVRDIVKKYKGRVHLITHKENRHLSASRNTGIKYAISQWNPDYLVMLDADDKVHPDFIERTLSVAQNKEYVYTNIKFFGDAWHTYDLPEYDPAVIIKKHQHACSFLMPTQMWTDVVKKRGYGYDENMKEGYEDWEFALAALREGWCGYHLPEYLFYYRNHKDGSMRSEALKINNKLTKYVQNQHKWMFNPQEVEMACSTCGGRRTKVKLAVTSNGRTGAKTMVEIAGVGTVDPGEPIEVTYNGIDTGTKTKIGRGAPGGGQAVYRYSANPNSPYGPKFTIFAIDANLFNGTQFTLKRINQPELEMAVSKITEPSDKPTELGKQVDPLVKKLEKSLTVEEVHDDLTQIKGIGKAKADSLNDAGFYRFRDVAEAYPHELSSILKLTEDKVKEIQETAKGLIKDV